MVEDSSPVVVVPSPVVVGSTVGSVVGSPVGSTVVSSVVSSVVTPEAVSPDGAPVEDISLVVVPLLASPVDADAGPMPLADPEEEDSNEHARAAHPSRTHLRIEGDRTCYAARMRVVGLLAASALTTCGTSPEGPPPRRDEAPAATLAAAPEGDLEGALRRITAADLRKHVEFLSSDAMRGRPTPSPELDEAARHISDTLARAGVDPGPSGARRLEVPCGPSGETAANVVGVLPGSRAGTVLVTAHYDHVGEASAGDDRVFNGANDNASGVAAMLEIADALAHAPSTARRSIAFVAFCGEEHGFRGSRSFVEDPPFPLESVVSVLNLEMLGHPDPGDARRAWVTGYAYSSLPTWLDRAAAAEDVSFVPGAAIGPVEGNAFDRSDNYPFALRGVVAHTIAVGPLDETYHAVTDEADRIDTDAMVPLVRALGRAALELATDETHPRWTEQAPPYVTRPASRTSAP